MIVLIRGRSIPQGIIQGWKFQTQKMNPTRAAALFTWLSQLMMLLNKKNPEIFPTKCILLNLLSSFLMLQSGNCGFYSGQVFIESCKFKSLFSLIIIFFKLWIKCPHRCSNSRGKHHPLGTHMTWLTDSKKYWFPREFVGNFLWPFSEGFSPSICTTSFLH